MRGYRLGVPRPAKHDESRILEVAARLVAERGPAATTVTAISKAMGAPSGSIYHRFKTRDELLGRLWLSKAAYFQDRWMAAFNATEDPCVACLEAALSLPRATRDDFEGAKIMLLHRREDFQREGWPAEMKAEADRLGQQVVEGLKRAERRLFGRSTSRARQIATFAVLDLPFATVHRYVRINEVPPPIVDELIEIAYHAVIDRYRT